MKKVIVVGSGIAGTLVANDLAKDFQVTVLEVGPKGKFIHPPITFRQKKFGVVKTFCYGEGGTSNLWHNGLMPMREDDVAPGDFKLALEESKHYIDPAAKQLFFPNNGFLKAHSAMVSEKTDAVRDLGIFSDGLDCLIYPKKYSKLQLDPRITTYFSVSGLRFSTTSDTIDRVFFESQGMICECPADFIIFSAGSLGTPSLVASLGQQIGNNGFCNAGAGLIDHPMGFVGKVKFDRQKSQIFRALALDDHQGYFSCSGMRIRHRGYVALAFFRPALTMENNLAVYKFKSKLGASSGFDQIKAALSRKVIHPDILAEIYAHIFGTSIRSNVFNILVFFEQKRSNNVVATINGKLAVDWDINDEEMRVYNEMLGVIENRLASIAKGLVITKPLTKDWLWSGAHHSGTVPVGILTYGNERGLPEYLLDKNLKLRGFSNIFICDGSVFNEHSYTNTGLTIGSLALRLSDHLRRNR